MSDPHDTWYVCVVPFVLADPAFPDVRGRPGVTRVRGSDPLYRKYPQYFEPITSSDRSAVEEAVAIPGRKRGA